MTAYIKENLELNFTHRQLAGSDKQLTNGDLK
jgi:hypothetical protein